MATPTKLTDGRGIVTFEGTNDAELYTVTHAAPADASLKAGDCVLWFDQTDGAGKLMVKAKTANGTVATGSVNLA